MTMRLGFAAAAACMLSGGATAATYIEQLDLPAYRVAGPRVLQATSALATGQVLSAANQTANPSGWDNALNVSVDTVAQTITLTGDGGNGYQTISVDISGITEVAIGTLTEVSTFGAFAAAQGSYHFSSGFTGSSLSLNYAADDVPGGDYFTINTGSSVFHYDLAGDVPEPTTWAMMLTGFGAVGVAMRRRQQAAAVYAV